MHVRKTGFTCESVFVESRVPQGAQVPQLGGDDAWQTRMGEREDIVKQNITRLKTLFTTGK